MSGLRVLHLYRPRLPSTRAQSIQVINTCHALAVAGCEVTLLGDAPRDNMPQSELPTVAQVLEFYGLPPHPNLVLKLSPTAQPSPQGFWFRKHALWWWWRASRDTTRPAVILARAKRYVDEYSVLPWGPPVVLEAHEVDSELAAEAREDPAPLRALEERLLRECAGLVTNCEGTMRLLERAHPGALPENRAVVYNATAPSRVRDWRPGPERIVGYLGSLRSFKGLLTLVRAAPMLPEDVRVELLGGSKEEIAALQPLPPSLLTPGDQPYNDVPDRVARWRCAVVALDDNVFGRSLCNPLKLWDYRAVGLPLVLPDLPTLREVMDASLSFWYTPGDADSLAHAIERALVEGPEQRGRRRHLRSWADRAQELLPILERAAKGPG